LPLRSRRRQQIAIKGGKAATPCTISCGRRRWRLSAARMRGCCGQSVALDCVGISELHHGNPDNVHAEAGVRRDHPYQAADLADVLAELAAGDDFGSSDSHYRASLPSLRHQLAADDLVLLTVLYELVVVGACVSSRETSPPAACPRRPLRPRTCEIRPRVPSRAVISVRSRPPPRSFLQIRARISVLPSPHQTQFGRRNRWSRLRIAVLLPNWTRTLAQRVAILIRSMPKIAPMISPDENDEDMIGA